MTDHQGNPARLYIESLGPGSRQTMKHALKVVAEIISKGKKSAATLDWGSIGPADADRVRSQLIVRYSPASGRKILAALNGVVKMTWRIGLIDAERRERIVDFSPIRGRSAPPGRALTDAEIFDLFSVCDGDSTDAGARDAALLVLLFSAGLRRTEAAELTIGEVFAEDCEITVRSGKGRKGRRVPISQTAVSRLEKWILIRGRAPGRLLKRVSPRGRALSDPLGSTGIQRITERRSKEANIERALPHDFRRSFVTRLLDRGVDLNVVRQLAGHSNADTTSNYDRRGFNAQRRAVEKLEIPGCPE